MEIYDKQNSGYISVWFTKEEQQLYDRSELAQTLLSKAKSRKCKVVFFLSGNDDLFQCTNNLLIRNIKCV